MLILTWVGNIFVNILIPSVLNVYKYNAYPYVKMIIEHGRIELFRF